MQTPGKKEAGPTPESRHLAALEPCQSGHASIALPK